VKNIVFYFEIMFSGIEVIRFRFQLQTHFIKVVFVDASLETYWLEAAEHVTENSLQYAKKY
jgi:hypothetical protein